MFIRTIWTSNNSQGECQAINNWFYCEVTRWEPYRTQYPRSNIPDAHVVADSLHILHTRENHTLHQRLKSHHGATPVNVYGKKVIGLRMCVPLYISRECPWLKGEWKHYPPLAPILLFRRIILRMTKHLKIAYVKYKGVILSNYFKLSLYCNINWISILQYWVPKRFQFSEKTFLGQRIQSLYTFFKRLTHFFKG